jgi:hypothetical protein
MNRRESLLTIIGFCIIPKFAIGKEGGNNVNVQTGIPYSFPSPPEYKRIDSGDMHGYECRFDYYDKPVIVNENFTPYRTLNPCKIYKRLFIPDHGNEYELPSIIDNYDGPAVNLETGEKKQ